LGKKVNTYLIGDVLEAKSFEIFGKMLKDERLYIRGKGSKISRKAKYFSKDREADITFDMAIETTMPGEISYSLLTLFECKNYGDSVQVGDVETFSDRVRQVGGHKGIMITATPFQKSALAIARSRKVGIVRINSSNDIEWINHRLDEKDLIGKIEYLDDLLIGEKAMESAILSTIDGSIFTSVQDLLIYLGVIDKYYPPLTELKIPFKEEIEIQGRIDDLRLENCYDHYKLNIQRLCQRISELYDVDIKLEEDEGFPSITIGRIQYNPLIIYVNPSLGRDTPRWRFTVSHEIGHLVLHSYILKDYFAATTDDKDLKIISPGISADVIKRMEIQANRFAALLLMPTIYFKKAVENYFKRESINKGFIYMDHQIQNIKLVMALLSELENIFCVSKEAAKVKLKQMGLLKGGSEGSIMDHIKNMGF
jgi:Zn-dependent peptidase ImmA (M78 family)